MPRYRNECSNALNYSDSGGPWVEPGAEFEHEIPPAQLESHLRSGFISLVVSAVPVTPAAYMTVIDELHEHVDAKLVDAIRRADK